MSFAYNPFCAFLQAIQGFFVQDKPAAAPTVIGPVSVGVNMLCRPLNPSDRLLIISA